MLPPGILHRVQPRSLPEENLADYPRAMETRYGLYFLIRMRANEYTENSISPHLKLYQSLTADS